MKKTKRIGPHVVNSQLFYALPNGSVISCTCIRDQPAYLIAEMWREWQWRSQNLEEALRMMIDAFATARKTERQTHAYRRALAVLQL